MASKSQRMTTKPPGSYDRIAAAVVVAAVVIGAGIVASSYLGAATTVTQTVTTALVLPCSNHVWSASGSSTGSTEPVLLMRPGSTAFICVTYQSPWGGDPSQYTTQGQEGAPYLFGLDISTYYCVSGAPGAECGDWALTISHSFVVDASPSSIQPTPDTDYVSVVYTVTALSNSTGFYDNSAPEGSCGSTVPMAVGYAASQVNASDFLGPVVSYNLCLRASWAFISSSVSVGGMNVTYVAF